MMKKLLSILCLVFLVGFAGCSGPTDADGDGLNSTVEEQYGLSDEAIDTDGDGLNDTREVRSAHLNGTNKDTDGDGLNDSEELAFGSNASKVDTDGDEATDEQELRASSDPQAKHSDDDGVRDGVEIEHTASPTEEDTDGDGLSDKREIQNAVTEPNDPDTDGDRLTDGREQRIGTSPQRADTDGDGVPDQVEVEGATNATLADTDGDGLSDDVEAPPGEASPFDATRPDADGDGLNDSVEHRIGTDPRVNDTDGDGRSDAEEYNATVLDPTEQEVRFVEGSPQASWTNATLREETLKAVEFFAALPTNRTERNRTMVEAATTICNGHDRVVPDKAANVTDAGGTVYRDTYRIEHAAKAMNQMGASIDVGTVQGKMRTAREVSGMAGQYAPIAGSYNRLHNASCAVKRGEPGSKEDLYIASAEFTVDLVLAKEGVIYKAAFTTTGMASEAVGVNRLARVCGYKCVGLVQSELHWLVRGAYSGALDTASKTAIEGNITVEGWNESVRHNVGKYLANRTNATFIDGKLMSKTKVVRCVNENIDIADLPGIGFDLGAKAADVLRKMLEEQKLPESADLSFLTEIDGVQNCLNE